MVASSMALYLSGNCEINMMMIFYKNGEPPFDEDDGSCCCPLTSAQKIGLVPQTLG